MIFSNRNEPYTRLPLIIFQAITCFLWYINSSQNYVIICLTTRRQASSQPKNNDFKTNIEMIFIEKMFEMNRKIAKEFKAFINLQFLILSFIIN